MTKRAPFIERGNGLKTLIGLTLVIITLTALWGLGSASFVRLDDDFYVYENQRVQAGITWDNVKWAFSTTYFGFYYPLTWLSHMADCQLYGAGAGWHHVTSLLLHILSTLILFLALARMSGAVWRSGMTAALFAVHPLHVESVAWISERKDVLSTFFWFLCLLAYSYYAEKPSVKRYVPVFFAFLFGLMAKPMLVTLPFALILLDYWPLNRLSLSKEDSAENEHGRTVALSRLLLEKLPLFFLVPVFSFLTLSAQKKLDAVFPLTALPLPQRIANALLSYTGYIKKMFYPVDLSVFYPIPPKGFSVAAAFFCGLILAAATLTVLWAGKRRRYLVTGWFWYLGTLVPVIGLVQIGAQSMADRYTYVPLVGLFIIVSWGAAEIAAINRTTRKAVIIFSAALLAALLCMTRAQTRHWKDSAALFTHAIEVTSDNCLAHNNLGTVLYPLGKRDEAEAHFAEALRINPNYSAAHMNLGDVLADKGRNTEAIGHYEQAVRIKPGNVKALNKLGLLLVKEDRVPEAVEYMKKAVQADPGSFDSRLNLGYALVLAGRMEQAAGQFREALRIRPDSVPARSGLEKAERSIGVRRDQ